MAQLSVKNEKANKITSPEQVNDYIKTSNPGAWLINKNGYFAELVERQRVDS